MSGIEVTNGELVEGVAKSANGSGSAVMPGYAPRCHECAHRERFDNGKGVSLYLCMSQPYEEDEQFGILTWLDTANFESGHCLIFKKA